MSISSIGSNINSITYGTQPATSAATTASTATNSAATSAGGTADWVTLSPDAQAIAKLNSAGITVECVSLTADPGLLNLSGLASKSGTSRTSTGTSPAGDLTKTGFESALANYGATSTQADQYFKAIDTNNDGVVSNSELLTALGNTDIDTHSPLSQGLLSLMNTSHNGRVSEPEFTDFETSLVTSETPSV
jgi:hypothetical protein